MKKITILGDVMVEPPFLQQAKKGDEYDFYTPLKSLEHLFTNSNFIIANLETPLAGEEAVYTNRIVSFNAPDSIATALKKLGVNVVSTANNHCLDRGFEGLERTLKVLDDIGLDHTGTYTKGYDGDRNYYFEIDGTKFALIAYTHSTNYGISTDLPKGETAVCVNNLKPLSGAKNVYSRVPENYVPTLRCVEQIAGRKLIWEETIYVKKAMGISLVVTDEQPVPQEELDEFIPKIKADYDRAREKADVVIFYPHIGGQFNVEVGKYTETYLKKCVELGFDAVLGAHSHTTQKAEYIDGVPCFYSMGNVTMSPCTFYQVPECLAEYGLVAHLYVDDKKIQKTTISIIKMIEDENTPLHVVPVDLLYQKLNGEDKEKLIKDVASVYKRITGRELPNGDLQQEYEL